MGLVQHEGGPCGVLATIQVVLFFSLSFVLYTYGYVATDGLSKKSCLVLLMLYKCL